MPRLVSRNYLGQLELIHALFVYFSASGERIARVLGWGSGGGEVERWTGGGIVGRIGL